jgi:hypothetical protein
VLVADTGNNAIRRIGRDGTVTTIAIYPTAAFGEDIALVRPIGIAVDRFGATYVTDARGRVARLLPDGRGAVLAGWRPGFADGPGHGARFDNPTGIAIDAHGALIVADAGNRLVRRIAPAGLYDPDPPRSPLAPAPGFSVDGLFARVLPWPIDPPLAWHEIAGTMGEARGGAENAHERFHAGIDIHAPEGTPVHVVRSAKISQPIAAAGFGTLNESIAIGPFTYVHLRVGRMPRDVALPDEAGAFTMVTDATGRPARVRVRRGTRFNEGDEIGTVNRFAHVHLNAGGAGHEVNPLRLPLAGFVDTVPPTIERRGIAFYDERWAPLEVRERRRLVLSGRVRIVADAYDQVDGNSKRRRLGLYRLGYQVLLAGGTPAPGFERPRTTLVFDRLPQAANAAGVVYAAGSGITVYGLRRTRFRYIVTNRLAGGEAVDDTWDTTALPPGDYIVRVIAADVAGNETTADTQVVISRQ